MTNFDRLPLDQQKCIMYEVLKRHTRRQLADLIGVTPVTITNWRRDPVYQAALQEKLTEVIQGLSEEFRADYFKIAGGISAELLECIVEGRLRGVEPDKLMRMLHTAINDLRELEGYNKPEGDDKDPLAPLRKRMKSSPSGQRYMNVNKEEEEEVEDEEGS